MSRYLSKSAVLCLLACFAGAAPPDSPLRLLDLRWLARPDAQPRFAVDTWTQPAPGATAGDLFVIADITGPGVLHYVMAEPRRWVIEVDGRVILNDDGSDWRYALWQIARDGPGERPWAWPLVQSGKTLEIGLPVPFAKRCRILAEEATARLYVAGQRLEAPPTRRFGGPRWQAELDTALDFLGRTNPDRARAPEVESWRGLYPLPGSERLVREAVLDPEDSATLLTLDGAGEIVGMRFEFHLPYANRLRDLFIEFAVDGQPPSVRLPLVDFLGDMQPFFRLWTMTHGTWANGLQMPGRHEPWMVGWFRLPIPWREGLRIDLHNRHPGLPQQVRAEFQIVRGDPGAGAWHLAGARRTVDLPVVDGDTLPLIDLPQAGRLAMLTMFTTGHAAIAPWTGRVRLQLTDPAGGLLAEGFPLFPLAESPFHEKGLNLTWTQPRYSPSTWHGGERTFWLDPLPFPAGAEVQYHAGGEGGPQTAEIAALWYAKAPTPAAPLAPQARELPTVRLQPLAAQPGGWSAETEDLIDRALPSDGEVWREERLALDVLASGDALMMWSAPALGAYLDLLVTTPGSRYVQVWMRTPQVPGGGRFSVRLVPANRRDATPLWPPGSDDFARRSRGDVDLDFGIDCYSPAPVHVRASHSPTGYLRNPSPGDLARLRLVAAHHDRLLFVSDQVTMNPAPPLPEGWRDFEDARVDAAPPVEAGMMTCGRADFHSWGGLRIVALAAGSVRLHLATPVPAREDDDLVLRGRIVRGDWTCGAARLEPAGETVEWRLGQVPAGRAVIDLDLTTPAGGELLLNAWRFSPGKTP